jgi:hypothetical protein
MRLPILSTLLLLDVTAFTAHTQPNSINWNKVSGGGGTSGVFSSAAALANMTQVER